ncbi:MAG: Altronate dehydratase [Firmicutes bacterium]|nr:Altronate dehydratase [Bacillota bacterium]
MAIAVTVIPGGVTVTIPGDGEVVTNQEIPFGHKVALIPIPEGDDIIRYGEVICSAREDIKPGDWVHVHNTVSDI